MICFCIAALIQCQVLPSGNTLAALQHNPPAQNRSGETNTLVGWPSVRHKRTSTDQELHSYNVFFITCLRASVKDLGMQFIC